MIAVIFSPLYILACIYFFMRIIKYLNIIIPRFKNKIVKIIIIVIYTVFATSLVTAVLTPEGTMLKRITKQMSNWWLGTILYMALIVGLTDIISKILKIHWNKKRPN